MLANKDYFALGDNLRMNAQDNEKRASFYVDNATGNVTTKGDVTTLNDDETVNYSLNTIGANTAGIRREGDENSGGHRTIIEEQLVVNRDTGVISNIGGSFTVDRSGNLVASTLGNRSGTFGVNGEGAVKAANGAFTVDKDGNVTATEFTVGGYNLTDIGEKTAGITQYKNDTTYFKGAVNVEGSIYSKDGKFVIGEDSATYLAEGELNLGAEDGQTLTADKLSTINSVITDNGEVVSQGDVKSYDAENDRTNSLNKVASDLNVLEGSVGDIGDNVKHVKHYDEFAINGHEYDATVIEGSVAITKDRGIDVIGANGASVATITRQGVARFGAEAGLNVSIKNGDVTSTYYDEEGKVGHYSLNNIGDKTQNMWADGSQTNFSHSVNVEGSFSAGNGGAQLNGAWGKEASLKLRDAGNKTYTLTATQLGNINNVILENGVVNGAAGSVIGGVRFSGGGDLNKVNHINGALIEAYDADPDNGVSGLRISGVAMENGAIKVNAINGATVNYYGEGGLEISGVGMLNGDVSAQTFNGVSIEKDTDGSAVIGGIDIGNLNENVAAATKNIAGIKRTDSNNDGIDDTTTIENRVSIGRDKFTISGYGDDSFTMDSTGARFAGDVFFNNGYRAKFTYANGTTSLGDLAYNLDDLTAQVNDIYNRTQGIDRDANGNTVISNDGRTWENGTSTVTDNDGATVTVGEDITIDGGNLNVNNGDLNVGTSGEGGSGSGEGGSTGGNGGNGNFSSDINVGGNANVNGTVTVGDASDGKYTQVGESGMTIVGKDENNNTTTNNISDKGMTVTGENGTNNISDSGMTITGKDGNTTNNISDKGMTVTGSNGTTDISGGDISVDNSVTVAGGSENKTTINNEGITVGDKGTSIKNDSISVGDGGYIGDGDVRSGEGVSLNDTAERVGHLENRVGELEDRIDKVGAMAAAIANLRTMGYDPAAPTEVAVGIGQYRDETGAALGLFHYPNRDFMLSLSVSTSGDEVMGGIGATWKFGRKSPEKVAEIKKAQAEADARRAEEAKLAKAEEMKQAAKEAKIKAQQERHAKLAAERAAQAEAAK